MHVFGQWGSRRTQRENIHGENLQTPPRKAPGEIWSRNSCREATVLTTTPPLTIVTPGFSCSLSDNSTYHVCMQLFSLLLWLTFSLLGSMFFSASLLPKPVKITSCSSRPAFGSAFTQCRVSLCIKKAWAGWGQWDWSSYTHSEVHIMQIIPFRASLHCRLCSEQAVTHSHAAKNI